MTSVEEFDGFYRATRQRVAAGVFALVGDLAEAQDIAQEAYARAWQRWRKVGAYDDPEAWVRLVARRIAFNGWRSRRSRTGAYQRHGPAPPTPAPSEDTVVLVTALRELPVEQREAVVLHHLLGLGVDEVARQTGVPAGTVKSRLARGRKALAGLLKTDVTEVNHA